MGAQVLTRVRCTVIWLCLGLSGCATSPKSVFTETAGPPVTERLGRLDYELVTAELAKDFLNEQRGTNYVVVLGPVENSTPYMVNTSLLQQNIQNALLRAGWKFSAAIDATKEADAKIGMRKLVEYSKMPAQKGSMPIAMLSGRILSVERAQPKGTLLMYEFIWQLADVTTGVVVAQAQCTIQRLVTNQAEAGSEL